MLRKILSGILIGLSSLFLLLSVAGIAAAWIYNPPLKREALTRLKEVDSTLAQVQTDVGTARDEVERALRIIDAAEKSLSSLTQKTSDAKNILGDVTTTLNDQLIPNLKSTRDNITQVRASLENLRNSIQQLNSIPFVNLNIPGDATIANILSGLDSLDSGIANVQDLAERASTFVSDTSYILGGDFSESRTNLQNLLSVLNQYGQQLADWRAQVQGLIRSVPGWIDRASAIITMFLLWFGFSQFGLLLHGLSLWRGGDPLAGLREAARRKKDAPASPES